MQKVRKTIFAVFTGLILMLQCSGVSAQSLIPGGEAVGLKLEFDGVCITEVEKGRPADLAGLKAGDCIRTVNGAVTDSVETLAAQLAASCPIIVGVERNGQQMTFTVYPEDTPQGRQIGAKVMDGISGIGTVTFYDPQNKTVGVLGHGVNLPAKTELPELSGGSFYYTQITEIEKSRRGDPGELKGNVKQPTPAGSIAVNTENGLFGAAVLSDDTARMMPVADPSMLHTGDAVIRCCVAGTEVQEYSVQIVDVYPQSATGRDLLLKITDPELLSQTGGIVRGMSGSPIVQDGRLVGAVTHVLVDDPTKGYGIFIGTMLETAQAAA